MNKNATKTPPTIDHHGFVISKSNDLREALGIAVDRAEEIAKDLDNWTSNEDTTPADVLNSISTYSNENERMFASYIFGQGSAMKGLLAGLGDGPSFDDAEVSDDDLEG